MPNQQNILRLLRMLRPSSAGCQKIRIGALGDGGYVVNDDLLGLDGVVSLGIGADVSFDLALAAQGLRVFQYDPTVEGPPVHHSRFIFRKLAWARHDTESARSLGTILSENGLKNGQNGLILKFDVEGSEWDAFQSITAATLAQFRIIVGAFHFLDRVAQADHFEIMWHTFSTLVQNHIVTHIHANNCCGVELVEGVVIPRLLEVTYLRRDRASFVGADDPMPTMLDYPNVAGLPELVLTPFRRSENNIRGNGPVRIGSSAVGELGPGRVGSSTGLAQPTDETGGSLKVNIFIDSWAATVKNAAQIANPLHGSGYPVTVLHSDNNENVPVDAWRRLLVPNEWYFGKKFKKCLDEFNGDIMLHITADAHCDDWCSLVRRCQDAFAKVPQLGVWSPNIEGSNAWTIERTAIMSTDVRSLCFVTQTNEIVWALSKEVVSRMRLFDFNRSNCGWGIDIAASCFCHANNKLVAVDRDVSVYHPPGTGYQSAEAHEQMSDFLKQLTWQETLQHILISEYVKHKRS